MGTFRKPLPASIFSTKKLLESNALDFDDLLSKTVELFTKHPDVLGIYQEQFKYILVDEYQDTNHAQYILTTMLSKRHRNITVVGDASQSIYRFRGADFRNITNFKHDFKDIKEFHLEQNYRSTQIILDAATNVISKNTSHPILTLWTDKTGGDKIVLYESRTEHDEASFIITTILQANRPYTDHAILYRTNAQSRVLEEAFLRAGIPYILVGGTRFYDRKEIKDVLAYLKVLANPKDTVSYRRIEKLGVGRLKKFVTFSQTVKTDTKLISYSTLELMDKVLDTTCYLELYDANIEEEVMRLENIKELRSVATEFPVLSEFLETVSLLEEKYTKNTGKYESQCSDHDDIAFSKGLEFPIVYIVGMEEVIPPFARPYGQRRTRGGTKTLLCRSHTRKRTIVFNLCKQTIIFGTRTQNMVSRFISDIPEYILEKHVSIDATGGFREDELLL